MLRRPLCASNSSKSQKPQQTHWLKGPGARPALKECLLCYTIPMKVASRPRHFLSIADLSADELWQALHFAQEFKAGQSSNALKGKSVALLFEKPSLRTKVSFDVAVHQLGGHPLYLSREEVGLGQREPVSHVARVLERYVHCIIARVFSHSVLEEMAQGTSVPVINALSDEEHPCQIVGDLLTVYQRKGSLQGITLAFVGDGNNVARSLALGCATVGANFVIATPPGYQLPESTLRVAQERAQSSGAQIRIGHDPVEAVREADVVYTDVWTSMGQEGEAEHRLREFAGFQVDQDLLARAKAQALFMHCMPVHYGEEVAPGMLEHPQSVVFDQVENRLHAQKGILELIFGTR